MKIVACLSCKWYEGKVTNSNNLKCKAFDSIPDAIKEGDNNHKKPHKGDGGIQFERAKDKNKISNKAKIFNKENKL